MFAWILRALNIASKICKVAFGAVRARKYLRAKKAYKYLHTGKMLNTIYRSGNYMSSMKQIIDTIQKNIYANKVEVLIEPHPNKDIPLPKQAHPDEDVAYDLHYAGKTTILWPFQTKRLITNCKIALPRGIMGDVRPRSGLLSKGIRVAGTIDPGYRDFVRAIIYNGSLVPRIFRPGDRIAQLALIPVVHADWRIVESLPCDSQRGVNGFGSTGR